MARHLVILDRDGVINHDSDNFIRSAADWRAIQGSAEAVGHLSDAGFVVAVATNQSGIGRGLLDLSALQEIHQKMRAEISAHGGWIAEIAYCPHLPDDECACRKPLPGMLFDIASRLGVSLDGVPFIGDSLRDLDAAVAAGARPILVLTGNGRDAAASLASAGRTVETYATLLDAARALISEKGRQS